MQRRYLSPRPLVLILLLKILVANDYSLAQNSKVDFSELEKVIIAELKETNTPGAAVAIVSGNKIIFAKGFGISNVETGAPVTPDMLFRIGSTTKMYTTAVLVTLAEEGKLKLDVPIGNYVKGLSPKLAQLTAHQLMSHTAGVKAETPIYGKHDETALAATIRAWKDDYVVFEPGKIMSYANSGIALAGFIVEELGGKPYADQLRERLFIPLGMTYTTFRPTEAMTYPLSQGHDAIGTAKPKVVRPFADNAAYWPAGFMFSSADGLARFAIMFMNGGKFEGKQILLPSVIANMSKPHAPMLSIWEGGNYGYGLVSHDYRGLEMIEHGGSLPGFGCLFQMIPNSRIAVIALANKTGVSLQKSADKSFELLLSLDPKVEPPQQSLPFNEDEIANLVGTYINGENKIEIISKDNKLSIKQGSSGIPLTKVRDTLLSITRPGAAAERTITVIRNSSGQVEFLHLRGRAFKKVGITQ